MKAQFQIGNLLSNYGNHLLQTHHIRDVCRVHLVQIGIIQICLRQVKPTYNQKRANLITHLSCSVVCESTDATE